MEKEEEAFIRYLTKKNHASEQEKERLLEVSKISLVIDGYSDIFSDFDPRPFSQRMLSEDFLVEAKRASKEKRSGEIELEFLIAEHKRDLRGESVIKKRLHDHFKKHFSMLFDEMKAIKKRATSMIIGGIILMIFATTILYSQTSSFMAHLLVVIFEPAGWFTFWTGLDEIYKLKKDKVPDYDFYEKMSKVDIRFWSY